MAIIDSRGNLTVVFWEDLFPNCPLGEPVTFHSELIHESKRFIYGMTSKSNL